MALSGTIFYRLLFFGHPPNLSTVVTAASISKYIVVVAVRAAVYSSYFKAALL